MAEAFDAIVLGAGAAGLMCAARAGQRGRRVLVLERAEKPGKKILISGGGRCNFTNIGAGPANYLSANPHFAKSALARYTAQDFLELVESHDIAWHEKTLGQLFCDQKSGAIIQMLLDELAKGQGELRLETSIMAVTHADGVFRVETSGGVFTAPKLVVATGGLSIPKMGASGLAYDIARQFGHDIVETRPGLVPFTFSGELGEKFAAISGVAAPVIASVPGARFEEDLLFTHRGLSGPAALQTSSYWTSGEPLSLCLQTSEDMNAALRAAKQDSPKQTFVKALEAHVPARLAALLAEVGPIAQDAQLADLSHAAIDEFAAFLKDWRVTPMGTEGYRTAEVTVGGISTDGLNQKTMESRHVPGLYFIGECVDVTGWLGGYNFQWAWASAHAAALA